MQNKNIPLLVSATALPNYKLSLLYNDGVVGEVDLSSWSKNELFDFWIEDQNFSKFAIDKFGKMVWNDAVDMDPDAWYLQLINKTFEEYASNK